MFYVIKCHVNNTWDVGISLSIPCSVCNKEQNQCLFSISVPLCGASSDSNYRRSGNFRVKKLSYDKLKFFVGMTPYLISVNSAC